MVPYYVTVVQWVENSESCQRLGLKHDIVHHTHKQFECIFCICQTKSLRSRRHMPPHQYIRYSLSPRSCSLLDSLLITHLTDSKALGNHHIRTPYSLSLKLLYSLISPDCKRCCLKHLERLTKTGWRESRGSNTVDEHEAMMAVVQTEDSLVVNIYSCSQMTGVSYDFLFWTVMENILWW